MQPTTWDRVEIETIAPGVERQVVWGSQATTARFRLARGVHIARHDHPSEQFTWMLQGAMRMQLGGREYLLRAGDHILIPPGVAHEVWVEEDALVLDHFAPPRDDWKQGRQQYLAGKASV